MTPSGIARRCTAGSIARRVRSSRPHVSTVLDAQEVPPDRGQLGWIADYGEFLDQLDAAWRVCHRALVPGGRLVCVVGDVCLSRRRNGGRHMVVPLHASIQDRKEIGFRIRLARLTLGHNELTGARRAALGTLNSSEMTVTRGVDRVTGVPVYRRLWCLLSSPHRCRYSRRPRVLEGAAPHQVRAP